MIAHAMDDVAKHNFRVSEILGESFGALQYVRTRIRSSLHTHTHTQTNPQHAYGISHKEQKHESVIHYMSTELYN